uniref:Uncharacterized protein n=1 Tax=Strigops habroptila TaxID=2489341 RepID=A0A672UCU6_STRHB
VGKAEVQNLVIVLLQGLTPTTAHQPLNPVPPRPRTWVPGHLPGDAVVAVEKLLPQELVAGHGVPLLAHEPHREHVYVVQVEEDLVEDAVGEKRAAARVHRVILPPRLQTEGGEARPGPAAAPHRAPALTPPHRAPHRAPAPGPPHRAHRTGQTALSPPHRPPRAPSRTSAAPAAPLAPPTPRSASAAPPRPSAPPLQSPRRFLPQGRRDRAQSSPPRARRR